MHEPLNRPSLLASLDPVLKHLRKLAPSVAAGQIGLFDATPGLVQDLDPGYVRVEDWDLHTKLWHERKVLGSFVSGHPVNSYRGKFAGKTTHVCRDRHTIETEMPERCVVAALIRRVEVKPRIAFITLEDPTGALDLIAFNDEVERYAHCLHKDMVIAASLRVRRDGDRVGLQLLAAHKLGYFRARA